MWAVRILVRHQFVNLLVRLGKNKAAEEVVQTKTIGTKRKVVEEGRRIHRIHHKT